MRIIDWISDVCSSDLISAISRRAYGHADGRVVIGDIVVHLDGREPELKGVPMRLSNRESVIFLVLAKYHGRVVARETIYNAVYGLSDKQPFDKVIDVFICKLRQIGRASCRESVCQYV